jgi:polysaccharide export outer membrane protein
MKPGRLFILALLASGICCPAQNPAQNQEPVARPVETAAPAPAEPASAPQAPASGSATDSYIIGPSDDLTVTVWKEPSFSGAYLVRLDGMISIPLLGDVLASGKTPLQLADQIATKLKKFIQDPNVSVVIGQIHSKVVYMLGEGVKAGPIAMTSGMTLLEAISSAGGLNDYANAKKIYILRNEDGKHQKIPVHYKEALKGDSTFDLILKPGDTIVVP